MHMCAHMCEWVCVYLGGWHKQTKLKPHSLEWTAMALGLYFPKASLL